MSGRHPVRMIIGNNNHTNGVKMNYLPLVACAAFAAGPAAAHFQQILPSADVLPQGGPVTLELTFTHPMERGTVMEMRRPEAVGMLARGARTDLSGALVATPIE